MEYIEYTNIFVMFEHLVQGDREETQNLYKQFDNQEQLHVTQIIGRHKPQPAPSNPKQANMVRGSMQFTSTNRAMSRLNPTIQTRKLCVCVCSRSEAGFLANLSKCLRIFVVHYHVITTRLFSIGCTFRPFKHSPYVDKDLHDMPSPVP